MDGDEAKTEAAPDVLGMMKNHLLQNYTPACDAASPNTLIMTTAEVYQALVQVYPSASYSQTDVAEWMMAAGFKLHDLGNLNMQWLLAPLE